MIELWREKQLEVCRAHGVEPCDVRDDDKLGIALQRLGEVPKRGVREKPEKGTCGWYIWAGGEMGTEDDFFQPLHVVHLPERCPSVLPLLLLPPGWCFIVDGDYVDVWKREES